MEEYTTNYEKDFAFFNVLANSLQTVAALLTVIQIYCTHKTCGFSINFLLLYAISLAFKYVYGQSEIQLDIPEGVTILMKFQILLKIFSFFVTVVQLVVCLCCTEYSDDAIDTVWIVGAILASLVFAKDDTSIHLTVKERWMFGSYLDIAALISELILIVKTYRQFERFFIFKVYFFNMFAFDLFNFEGYESYRYKIYGNIGYKLMIVKLILWFGCFIKCYRKYRDRNPRENIPIEVVRTISESTPAEISLDMPVIRYILGEKYRFNNEHGLMSPN